MTTIPPVTFASPTSTSGTSDAYGLSSGARGATFDTAGLAGLGAGKTTGSDLLNAFIAAGSGQGDPTVAAAIQHALYLSGGYYPATFTPTPGRLRPDDIKAFAAALNQLADSNSATPQGAGFPQQTLAQFLAGAAASGVENGAYAGQQVTTHTYDISAPNPTNVAATYEAAARKILGRKPTAQETAAFVRTFSQQYVDTEKQNAQSDYQAQVAKAQQKAASTAGTSLPIQAAINAATPPTYDGGSAGAAEHAQQTDPQGYAPQTFGDQMNTLMSLQQAIAGSQGGQTDQMNTANTTDLPDASVAAENYVRNSDPKEAAANDLGDTMNNFLNLITTKLV